MSFFLLKVNSDFFGSRQYLTFRHQQLQKLQKLIEHRFLGRISAVTLQPDLKLCTLQKENCRSVPLMWHGYYKMDSLYQLLKA